MKGLLFVGLGGAIGAIMRYGISMFPLKSEFPFLTLFINILGAIMIGCIVGFSEEHTSNEDLLLFLKTGVCGGFTTFSTFSLEAVQLFEKHRYFAGGSYAVVSVVFCIVGVLLGKSISKTLFA
ncbi:fluoride efflux transporter CrcB [Amedibacillus sp. YH-ame6]